MEREVYPSAPLALVACEVRVPSTGLPPDMHQIQQLAKGFREILPVPTPLEEVSYTAGHPEATHHRTERFVSRDKTSSIGFRPGTIVVQTSFYRGYIEHFRPLIEAAVKTIHDVVELNGLTRIGLRYFDEIRVPGVGEDPVDWNDYFARPLVDVFDLGIPLDLTPQTFNGMASFRTEMESTLVLRWGPRDGPAIDTKGVRRTLPNTGPMFLIDIDSYWEPQDQIPPFDPKAVLDICDDLHEPVRDLFEATITDKLREIFRQEGPS